MGYWIIFLILGLIAALSIAVACLPLRPVWLRAVVLVAHIVASMVLIMAPEAVMRPLWVLVFGPGLLVALIRLVLTIYRAIHRALWPPRPAEDRSDLPT